MNQNVKNATKSVPPTKKLPDYPVYPAHVTPGMKCFSTEVAWTSMNAPMTMAVAPKYVSINLAPSNAFAPPATE